MGMKDQRSEVSGRLLNSYALFKPIPFDTSDGIGKGKGRDARS